MERFTTNVSRETSSNKGFCGKSAICKIHGGLTSSGIAHKVLTHNGFGYICPDCYKKAILSKQGTVLHGVCETASRKDATHGVRVYEIADFDNLTETERAYLMALQCFDRVGSKYISTAKVGTWQLSKVASFLGKDKFTVVAVKDGYEIRTDADTVIKAVRDISSNHGQLTDRIKNEYGFKKIEQR